MEIQITSSMIPILRRLSQQTILNAEQIYLQRTVKYLYFSLELPLIPANLFELNPCTEPQFPPVHWLKSLYTPKIFSLGSYVR